MLKRELMSRTDFNEKTVEKVNMNQQLNNMTKTGKKKNYINRVEERDPKSSVLKVTREI